MPIVTCPGCGKKLKVPALDAAVRCPVPSCRTTFKPQAAPAAAAQPSAQPAGGDDLFDELLGGSVPPGLLDEAAAGAGATLPGPPTVRRRGQKKQKSSSNTMLWVLCGLGGGIALLGLVVLIVVLAMGGRSQRDRHSERPSGPPSTVPTDNVPTTPRQPGPSAKPAQPGAQPTGNAATQPPGRPAAPGQRGLQVPLTRFTPAEATVLARFQLSALPADAAWFEELQAALRPLLQPVTPLIGAVEELWIAKKQAALLVGYQTKDSIQQQRLIGQWGAKQGEGVGPLAVYEMRDGKFALAFPAPNQLIVGNKDILIEALQTATSVAEPPIPKTLREAAIKEGTEVPVFLWVPSDLMRKELTKALSFVVEYQREEVRDAMQRPIRTGMVLRVTQKEAHLDLYFECKNKGEAETFGRWMGGLPDFARRLQQDAEQSQRERQRQRKNEIEDPARYRRSQIAGAVAALAGIWRNADVAQNGNIVRVRTKVPTSEDWITNRLELLTNPLAAALATDVSGTWPYVGPLDRFRSGLGQYLAKNKQVFPAGTIKAKGAEEWYFLRFSWMVHILPYIGRQNLHDSLDLNKPWSDPVNVRAALTVVDEFLDPRVPMRRGEAGPYLGLALTHFVGMGGVGYDAPTLPANHPRAGIFGYDRTTKASDIRDGAGQTILLIEVYDVYGPWVCGGGATVRPAQRPPYIGVTGAFGSPGKPEGVYVLMADGSVRYLSKSIDPRVFEALCTIAGREAVKLEVTSESLPNGIPLTSGTLASPANNSAGGQR